MARLVAFGDAHLGRTHLAHLRDEHGRNVREEDFLRAFSWAIAETVAREPDGFVWLGDVFDHARPTYRTFAHVLGGLQRLSDAGLTGAAISGNHDTPRVRGTGSPYDALERVFPNVTFAWRMEAVTAEVAGVLVHAVPQTMSVEDLRKELAVAAGRVRADATNVLLAHVALTSLPARAWRDINELEVEEAAFDRAFDLVLLGHYHAHQKASKRTWYAGSTDTFSFADSPETSKGLVVVDTDAGTVEHVENPHERPLATVSVSADGLSAGELVDAVEKAATGTPSGAIVRVYLNGVDPASFRQVGNEQFQEAVPVALWVQVEPDYGAEAFAVQGGAVVGSLEQEWAAYVEPQDLAGLERERVVALGSRFLVDAQGETV
jgi:DNA repair exonuclease SbcCD nuclease subunit